MELGERIKNARKSRGIKTQEELAKRMREVESLPETDPKNYKSSIGDWESGRKKPDFGSLFLLCQALECDADYLLGLQEERKKDFKTAAESLGISYELAEKWTKLSYSTKQALYYAVNNDAIGSFWEDVTKSLEQLFIKYGFSKYLREERAYYSRDRAETIDDFSHRKYHRLIAELTKSIENKGALDHLLHEMLDQHVRKVINLIRYR